jgi:hypothetical protein
MKLLVFTPNKTPEMQIVMLMAVVEGLDMPQDLMQKLLVVVPDLVAAVAVLPLVIVLL